MINKIGKKKLSALLLIVIIVLTTEVHYIFILNEENRSILTAPLLFIQMVAAVSDINKRMIPLWLIASSSLLGVGLLYFFEDSLSLKNHLICASLAFVIFAFLIVISKGQIGTGDLLLFTVTGFFTEISSILGILILSVLLTGIFSAFLILIKKRSARTEIPFAPFILLATAILTFS